MTRKYGNDETCQKYKKKYEFFLLEIRFFNQILRNFLPSFLSPSTSLSFLRIWVSKRKFAKYFCRGKTKKPRIQKESLFFFVINPIRKYGDDVNNKNFPTTTLSIASQIWGKNSISIAFPRKYFKLEYKSTALHTPHTIYTTLLYTLVYYYYYYYYYAIYLLVFNTQVLCS